jgi:hypothetical protein
VKNEHSTVDNQGKATGATFEHPNEGSNKKTETDRKEENKQKMKRRQTSHSAGAGKGR